MLQTSTNLEQLESQLPSRVIERRESVSRSHIALLLLMLGAFVCGAVVTRSTRPYIVAFSAIPAFGAKNVNMVANIPALAASDPHAASALKTRLLRLQKQNQAQTAFVEQGQETRQVDNLYPTLLQVSDVPKFVNKCPQPSVLKPSDDSHHPHFEISMEAFEHDYGLGLVDEAGQAVLTKSFGYNGQIPGPTIEVEARQLITIDWTNNLPLEHVLEIDETAECATSTCHPDVRASPRVYGAHTTSSNSGFPTAWSTADGYYQGAAYSGDLKTYPNEQEPATLWYHDNAKGASRLNTYAGMFGAYLLRNQTAEVDLQMPSGAEERVYMLQDMQFHKDGSLAFGPWACTEGRACEGTYRAGETAMDFRPQSSIMVVNGVVFPTDVASPSLHRFHFVNTADYRAFDLYLEDGSGQTITPLIMASEQGFLQASDFYRQSVRLAPGERVDIVYDFRGLEGQTVVLKSKVDDVNVNSTVIMQWEVATTGGIPHPEPSADWFHIRTAYLGLPALEQDAAMAHTDVYNVRRLTINSGLDELDRTKYNLGTQTHSEGLKWTSEITEVVDENRVEEWQIINLTPVDHPIHIDGVHFFLTGRQSFDAASTNPIHYTGPLEEPFGYELGRKDTVEARAGQVTTVRVQFHQAGRFTWGGARRSHADHGLLRPFVVLEVSEEEIFG